MSKTKQIADAIIAQGMLPLYFNADETVSFEILRAVYKAGVKALEYTNRSFSTAEATAFSCLLCAAATDTIKISRADTMSFFILKIV